MGGGEGCGVSLRSGLAIEQPAPCALVTAAPATNQRPPQNAYHNVNANNVRLDTPRRSSPLFPRLLISRVLPVPVCRRLAVCPPSPASECVPARVACLSCRVCPAHYSDRQIPRQPSLRLSSTPSRRPRPPPQTCPTNSPGMPHCRLWLCCPSSADLS